MKRAAVQRASGAALVVALAVAAGACAPGTDTARCDRFDVASMGPENGFRVTVADATQAASASVEITVDPGLAAGDGGSGPASNSSSTVGSTGESDCGCTTVGSNGTTGFGALGAALAGIVGLVARKRRRS